MKSKKQIRRHKNKSKKFRRKLMKGGENFEEGIKVDPDQETGTVSDIDMRDKEGNTPLHLACDKGDLEEVKNLIEKGADVNAQNNPMGFEDGWGKSTPLHIACSGVNIEIVELLLKNRAEVNVGDESGDTPLHNCFREFLPRDEDTEYDNMGSDNLKLVKLLVENGAIVDSKNDEGITPLFNALSMDSVCYMDTGMNCFVESRINIAKYLIDKGADLKNNRMLEWYLSKLDQLDWGRFKDKNYKEELEEAFNKKQEGSVASVGGKRKTKKRKTKKRKTRRRKTRKH